MKTETTADILSEIRDLCVEVLNGSRKIEPTYLMTGRETRDLESACERNDVWEVLRQLHTFRGTPNAGEVIARLETAVTADELHAAVDFRHLGDEACGPDLF